MGNYKATSPKNPDTNYTEEVVLEKNNKGEVTKSIRVGGAPVELDEDQLTAARRYLNVREATAEEINVAEGNVGEVQTKSEDQEAADQQVAGSGVESNPPDSPAAAEARTQLGRSRARGGE